MDRVADTFRPKRIEERSLRFLYSFWRYVSAERGFAHVAKMRPELLTVAFPGVAFVDNAAAPGSRLRLRCAGREAIRLKNGAARELGAAMAHGKPQYRKFTRRRDGRTVTFGRLLLPLSRGGRKCDSLLVAVAASK
jgi:hypothetical protein